MCTIDLSKLKNAIQLKCKLIVPALINLLLGHSMSNQQKNIPDRLRVERNLVLT